MTTDPGDFGCNDDPSCGRCGSSMGWDDCPHCDEDGFTGHDCGEGCCCCEDPEPNIVCSVCHGKTGWWTCLSSADWCQAHPLPGREAAERGSIAKEK